MPATENPDSSRYPCPKCGASLEYQPGTSVLICPYCGNQSPIEQRPEPIQEFDFHQALETLDSHTHAGPAPAIQCQNCAASFQFEGSLNAGRCPFCGSPVILKPDRLRPIQPKSLLPFTLGQSQAKQRFQRWLKGLWFAPSALKHYAREQGRLTGIYLPFWTFDSHTETSYRGARGIFYTVTRPVTVIENGRAVRRLQTVQKVRWLPVQGRVQRFFDDILIGASRSLPRQILDSLGPWDLQNLIPYNEKYLSGFNSEVYQISLDQGFDHSKQIMDQIIRQDIRADIGGDLQQIHWHATRHLQVTFKHCLLPVWIAAYRYRNRTYRIIINGRTGKVLGERPYSPWKILVAVIGVILVIGAAGYFLQQSGVLAHIQSSHELIPYDYPELAK